LVSTFPPSASSRLGRSPMPPMESTCALMASGSAAGAGCERSRCPDRYPRDGSRVTRGRWRRSCAVHPPEVISVYGHVSHRTRVLGSKKLTGTSMVDASHGVHALLKAVKSSPRSSRWGCREGERGRRSARAPRVLLPAWTPPSPSSTPVAVGLVDLALVDLLAGRGCTSARTSRGNARSRRPAEAGRVRLDGDDHDRVGEVGPVVSGAPNRRERDVDPRFRGNLVVLDF